MGDNFFTYLGRLEVMGFFSAYPLLYALVYVLAGTKRNQVGYWQKTTALLPYAYAICAILYAGLQVRTLYPDFSAANISNHFNQWLKIWGIAALIFWIPLLNRRPVFSLLHSLVVFFFLLKDLYLHTVSKAGKEVIQNDMKVFTDSLILNTASLLIVMLISFIIDKMKRRKKTLS